MSSNVYNQYDPVDIRLVPENQAKAQFTQPHHLVFTTDTREILLGGSYYSKLSVGDGPTSRIGKMFTHAEKNEDGSVTLYHRSITANDLPDLVDVPSTKLNHTVSLFGNTTTLSEGTDLRNITSDSIVSKDITTTLDGTLNSLGHTVLNTVRVQGQTVLSDTLTVSGNALFTKDVTFSRPLILPIGINVPGTILIDGLTKTVTMPSDVEFRAGHIIEGGELLQNKYSLKDHHHDGRYVITESDPTVPSHVKSITQSNINAWNLKVPDTPSDDILYGRQNQTWINIGKMFKNWVTEEGGSSMMFYTTSEIPTSSDPDGIYYYVNSNNNIIQYIVLDNKVNLVNESMGFVPVYSSDPDQEDFLITVGYYDVRLLNEFGDAIDSYSMIVEYGLSGTESGNPVVIIYQTKIKHGTISSRSKSADSNGWSPWIYSSMSNISLSEEEYDTLVEEGLINNEVFYFLYEDE